MNDQEKEAYLRLSDAESGNNSRQNSTGSMDYLPAWKEMRQNTAQPRRLQRISQTLRGRCTETTLLRTTLILLTIFLLNLLLRSTSPPPLPPAPIYPLATTTSTPTNFTRDPARLPSRFAYAVMLSTDGFGEGYDSEDSHYFIGTRMLIHQLLHNPSTRGRANTDFIVLVSGDVSQDRRDRLAADGAIVMDAPHLADDDRFAWIEPGGMGRWQSVLDKMEVFRLVQYERILLMDTDVVVVRPIDDIFTSKEVKTLRHNKHNASAIVDDEPPQPEKYLFAATCNRGRKHTFPVTMCDNANAGFVVLAPSLEMYDYYLGVMALDGRFDGTFPEQNLWNYIHRWDGGNMPWVQLGDAWNIVVGNWEDYEAGMRSFHEKFWWIKGDQKLTSLLMEMKGRMLGFYDAIGGEWPKREH